jgi:hypothetical protein
MALRDGGTVPLGQGLGGSRLRTIRLRSGLTIAWYSVVGPLVHQQQRVGCAMEMPSPSQVLLLCLIIFSLGAILWFLLYVLNFV